jgi:hypothetical protein
LVIHIELSPKTRLAIRITKTGPESKQPDRPEPRHKTGAQSFRLRIWPRNSYIWVYSRQLGSFALLSLSIPNYLDSSTSVCSRRERQCLRRSRSNAAQAGSKTVPAPLPLRYDLMAAALQRSSRLVPRLRSSFSVSLTHEFYATGRRQNCIAPGDWSLTRPKRKNRRRCGPGFCFCIPSFWTCSRPA